MDGNKLDKVGIIGHSFGGKVAMTSSLLYPDRFKYLIVLDIAPIDYKVYNFDYISETRNYLHYMKAITLEGKNRKEVLRELKSKIHNRAVIDLLNLNLVLRDG